jgi:hypothetical protein
MGVFIDFGSASEASGVPYLYSECGTFIELTEDLTPNCLYWTIICVIETSSTECIL